MADSSRHLFCPRCGDLLSVQALQRKCTCGTCSFACSIDTFTSVSISSRSGPADWLRRYGVQPVVKERPDLDGEVTHARAVVDDDCPKCGHRGLEFYTLQLRSADEGQTVFYSCPKCKHKFSQNT